MEKLKRELGRSAIFIVIVTILCLLYTGVITLVGQIFFSYKANGSIIEVDEVKYGSEFIGQSFMGSQYMWGRAMDINNAVNGLTDNNGKKTLYPQPSNISPASPEFDRLIKQRVRRVNLAHIENKNEAVPVDLVTVSGSGLDPHISYKAAIYQAKRIARVRGMPVEKVIEFIDKCAESKFLKIFGGKIVNVLKVNLYLDNIIK